MKTVGQINAYDMGRRTSPVFDPEFMENVAGLGQHLAESVGKEFDDVEWYGETGVCPVCHNKLISPTGKGTEVECPLCGIYGDLEVSDGTIRVTFSEAEKKRARNTLAGLYEHYHELHDMMEIVQANIAAHKDDMGDLLAPFYRYAPDYKE